MYKKILEKIESIPFEPGCYLYKNAAGEIIYVGKAKSLRKRVRQYFQKELYREPKIEIMVSQIADLDWITVKTETDALILEANLIKKYRPKYNKLQKDDKQYVWIKITNEDIPRVIRVREKKRDGAKYFGPFPDGNSARKTLIFLRRLYPYRVCNNKMFYWGKDALQCVSTKNQGKFKNDNDSFRHTKASRLCLDYHIGLCSGPCDNLVSIEEYKESISKIKEFLKGKRTGLLKSLANEMKSYSLDKEYEKAATVRDRISELNYITQKISIRSGEDEERILLRKEKEKETIAKQLFDRLGIKELSESLRIECYDVSNIQGTDPVTSMVAFEKGRPKKSDYRYFKIRSKDTPDDYAMMAEGLKRRLKYLTPLNPLTSLTPLAPLIPASGTGRGEEKKLLPESGVLGEKNKLPSGDGVGREQEVLPPDKGGWGGYIPYDIKLTKLARENRKNPTLAEQKFWYEILKNENLQYKFSRQKPIGNYIVDFYCAELMLAIEIDGDTHAEQMEYDRKRTVALNSLGIRVVRYTNTEVLENVDGVYEDLSDQISKRTLLFPLIKGEKEKLPPDKGGWGGYTSKGGRKMDVSFSARPDLIIVDGGKGQLGMALEVVESFGLKIPVVGIAKREEEIIKKIHPDPPLKKEGKERYEIIRLRRDSRILHLVQQLRDEAHRFAITKHRNLRGKKMVKTVLSEIPGVGGKSIEKLIKAFGSVDEIKKADFEALNSVLNNKAKAAEIVRFWK